MKYIAVIDDELLKNFRVDADIENGMVMEVKDKYDCTRGIKLLPIQRYVLTNEDGISIYLRQEHVDTLKQYEDEQIAKECVKGLNKNIQEMYERVYMPIGNENLRKRREEKR